MEPTDIVVVTASIEVRQRDDIKSISTKRVNFSEHIRRALDMYMSQPAIMEALAAKQEQV